MFVLTISKSKSSKMMRARFLECTICKEHMSTDDIFYTPCSHIFDSRCIQAWLKRSNTCPQCRQTLRPHELRRLYTNVSSDTSIRDECLAYENRISALNSLLSQKSNQIEQYRSQLQKFNNELSLVLKEVDLLRKRAQEPNSTRRLSYPTLKSVKEMIAATENPAELVSLFATMKSEMKSCVAAERQKRLETTKKLRLERAKLVELKKALRSIKMENRAQQRKIKELEKIKPPLMAAKKPSAKTVSSNENSDGKVDAGPLGPIQPIATRTRSRTLR